jgi:hypothetical protein
VVVLTDRNDNASSQFDPSCYNGSVVVIICGVAGTFGATQFPNTFVDFKTGHILANFTKATNITAYAAQLFKYP